MPPTDGAVHVAFALKFLTAREATVDLSVSYTARDSFVFLVSPAAVMSGAVLTFTPRSATVGAHAYTIPGYGAAPDVAITATQSGQALLSAAKCDFGSEIDCIGQDVTGHPVTIAVAVTTRADTRLGLYIAWE